MAITTGRLLNKRQAAAVLNISTQTLDRLRGQLQSVRAEAQRMLAALFATYRADPALLPLEWRPADEAGTLRAIGDFIAGMTDRYAIRQYRDLIGEVALPEGF